MTGDGGHSGPLGRFEEKGNTAFCRCLLQSRSKRETEERNRGKLFLWRLKEGVAMTSLELVQ